jgi:hypothetical protein
VYDNRGFPLQTGGNVYYRGARPYNKEAKFVARAEFDPKVKLAAEGDHLYLHLSVDEAVQKSDALLVTTAVLGKAKIPNLPYERPDGTPIRVDTDYFGKSRSEGSPTPGPFQNPGTGPLVLKVW